MTNTHNLVSKKNLFFDKFGIKTRLIWLFPKSDQI